VVAPLVNLNIYYGDIDKAIALLESYVIDHPRSLEARKKLADLFKSSERFDHYCTVMEEIETLSHSADNLRKLTETYAFLGRTRDEMNALARLISSDDYVPEEADYYKLASYYRVDHQNDKAINVISDYIEDNHYHVGLESITLAIELLQEADKEDDALSMAESFLKKQPREDDAIMLSTLFESHGQFDSGYAVLKPFLANIEHSTDLEQQVADIMLEQKKDDELFDMLAAQRAKQGSLPPSLAVTLTDLAVTRADYDTLEALIRTQDLEKMPESALLRYADMSYRLKRPDLAQIIQGKLSASYFHEAPVLEVVLAVAADDTPKTMAALTALPHSAISTSQEKLVLSEIYVQHGLHANAYSLLDTMSVDDVLESFDAEQYAEIYLDMGAATKAEQALNAARERSPDDIKDSIDQTLVLLAAGTGKIDFIRQKLANYKPGDLWPDTYDFALHYNHNDLALMIAEKLYKFDPSEANRLQLAEAQMFNGRYVEALNNLQPLVEKSDDARAMFLDAIASWAQQAGGVQGMPEAQRASLNAIISSAMKNKNMPLDERRDLAYVLEDIGFNTEAESVLMMLANGQPADGPDVEELLGFWSDHPSNIELSWVEDRARHSIGNDRAHWLTYLNENEQPQAVLDIIGDATDLPPAVADQYVYALVETKNKDKLEYALNEYIETETSVERLKRMGEIADEEDLDDAAAKAWRKIYSFNQNDSETIKQVGIIDFNAGNYEEAEALLKQYLQYNQDDYRANLTYGEILQHDDRKTEAEPYFQHALDQISAIQDKDEPTRLDEAYLLYSTNHITESLALFRQLVTQYPNNKDVRADYAEVLTEMGRFDEAAALLGR